MSAASAADSDVLVGQLVSTLSYQMAGTGDRLPEWTYWLDRTEIDVMAGRCMDEMDDPAAAEPLLARAITSYDTPRPGAAKLAG